MCAEKEIRKTLFVLLLQLKSNVEFQKLGIFYLDTCKEVAGIFGISRYKGAIGTGKFVVGAIVKVLLWRSSADLVFDDLIYEVLLFVAALLVNEFAADWKFAV